MGKTEKEQESKDTEGGLLVLKTKLMAVKDTKPNKDSNEQPVCSLAEALKQSPGSQMETIWQ